MELKMVEVQKKYKDVIALNRFSYSFTPGIYALIGPNGAGKSTLMNILTLNLKYDKGDILLNGVSIAEKRKDYLSILGYMPQQQTVFPGLTLQHFMMYMASLKGIKKSAAVDQTELLLKNVELWEYRNKKLGTFSGGMKQRALLAQAFLGTPEIIILDEPTEGMDPLQRVKVRKMIKDISGRAIVIVSSHILSDLDPIADEIILLKKGQIIPKETVMKKSEKETLEDVYIRIFGVDSGANRVN